MGRFLASLAAAATLVASHKCIHDNIVTHPHLRVIHGEQAYEEEGSGRRLDASNASAYAPLRIQPIYTNLALDTAMTPALVNFLQNKLFPAAVSRWQSALSVLPVVGPLYAHRQCSNTITSVTPNLCSGFTATTPCANVGDGITLNFADTYLGADTYYTSAGNPTEIPADGPGLANADFGVFVTAQVRPGVTRCVSWTKHPRLCRPRASAAGRLRRRPLRTL